MAFIIDYQMITGSGRSICLGRLAAAARHRELLLAGASSVVVSEDGVVLTREEIKALERPGGLKPER
jgi:hypothetical protein